MFTQHTFKALVLAIFVVTSLVVLKPNAAYAHCDSLDGPVVQTARAALDKGDVTPVLKWVKKEYEDEVRKAFSTTLTVRKLGAQARELADMYLFETLVRIHRAGEGAPYTGLKPAGTHNPVVEAADRALKTGNADKLKKHIAEMTTSGIQKRFDEALEKKKHAEESIEAGRQFVEAYVVFVHYVENVFLEASGEVLHHGEPGETSTMIQHVH
jgi:hypothetical protein